MNHNIKSKASFAILGLALATSLGMLVIFYGNDQVVGQPISEVNIGNTTSESSDTFFQLDNSIEIIKSLVNETQASLNTGNTTEANNFLNHIYNELVQISNNSNNLIWDLSNEGN
ncbi:hypothetical protein [Candidatus Nitrosocosmicus hydrocola]|uniref:hypothetical protein n=1 Tax=Candidatus Nitrosocosmicus hydrocola TaxID=1826872 RepID=UPI0011E5D92C|nr:hypothetical protein [Candidatus Nitrosocosmicus hydrocola]